MDKITQRQARREKRHRNREIVIALVLIFFVCLGTWGQTTFFGSDSWYFIALLNLNAILMLVVCYLAVRNIIKLLAERRRKVFGARLRTRLLLSFVSLSLIPVFLMFLAANRVVITSIDYWFTSTVASSMDAALQVGQNVYNNAAERLTDRAKKFNLDITNFFDEENLYSLETYEKVIRVENFITERAEILTGNAFALVEHTNAFTRLNFTEPSDSEFVSLIQNVFDNTDWNNINTNHQQFSSYAGLYASATKDYAVAIQSIDALPTFYIIIAESIGNTAQTKLTSISQGFEEYTYLKSLKRPLKLSFSLILGFLGLIMIFSSIFMAFRLSKELTAPIEALSKGTDRIAQGELDILLEDKGKDELGQLVASFNAMVKEVRSSNEKIILANQTLEQRNIFIETILKNISAGVFVLTLDGKVLNINKAGSDLFNIKTQEWENRQLEGRLSPQTQAIVDEMLTFFSQKPKRIWKKEIEINIAKKPLKIFITALTVPDFPTIAHSTGTSSSENNDLIIAVVEDITELTRAERIGAWREVAKRIAHEMKNPLTPIRLSAERLERKYNQEPKEQVFSECTQLIITEVERMQKMIKNFTEFAQIPEVKLQEENILDIIQESLQIFKSSHTHIKWETNFPTLPPPMLLLDAERIKQVLVNIYLNACEVLENVEKPQITTTLSCKNDNCVLSIADNGIGLTPETLARIFEPYYSRKKDGTGLGLSIVQSIIAEHKATIHAENNSSGGTNMIITFSLNS